MRTNTLLPSYSTTIDFYCSTCSNTIDNCCSIYSTTVNFCGFHLQLNQHLTTFLQRHKHKERTASSGIYGQRLRGHVRPQTPVTYKWDNCRTNIPTDRQEFVPIRLRIQPRCWQYTAARTTRRWHCTATRIDKLRTDMPVELRPVDKTSRRYACRPEPVAGTILLLQ